MCNGIVTGPSLTSATRMSVAKRPVSTTACASRACATKYSYKRRPSAGTAAELTELKVSYGHLVKLRDEVVAMGVLPPLADWKKTNPNL